MFYFTALTWALGIALPAVALVTSLGGRRCMTTQLYADANAQVFTSWLKNEGGIDGRDINVRFLGRERGLKVVAAGKIKKGDLLLSVPQDIALDAEKAAGKFPTLSKGTLKTGNVGLLALLLLSEKLEGDKSKYFSYLQQLPEKVPGVLAWGDEELNELCKSTTRRVKSQLSAIEHDISLVAASGNFPNEAFSRESFLWAVGIVKSRALFVPNLGTSLLVPGMDAIAFDPFSTAEPSSQGGGMFGKKCIRVTADRSYEEGEEVFISFGLKSSAECLEDHGQVPEMVEEDCSCELVLDIDPSTDRFPDDKLNVLEQELLPPNLQVDLEAGQEVEVDPMLLQYARLKSIEGQDAFILEACFLNTVWDTLSLPFSKANEAKALQTIIGECEAGLERMLPSGGGGSIESGAGTGARTGESPAALMARLRSQERRALESTLAKLREQLALVQKEGDTTEYYQERRLRELALDRPLEGSEIVLPLDDGIGNAGDGGGEDTSWMR